MKLILGIIIVCCLLFLTANCKRSMSCSARVIEPDYYWREYTGVIPADAVTGGSDVVGQTTYIGQATIHPYGTLVATIYQGNKTATTSAYQTHYVDKDVKILCSNSPEKFKWIPTDIDKIDLITNCHLLVGDVDHGYQGNIGRVNFDEQILLGKIIRLPQKHHGLFVPYKGEETRLTHYEVLGYDCK